MENASKALIIAGAILLSIAIIGIGMYVFRMASSTINEANMSAQEIDAYNAEFQKYEGVQNGSMIKALLDKIRTHNLKNSQDNSKMILVGWWKLDSYTIHRGDATANDGDATVQHIQNMKKQIHEGTKYEVTFRYTTSGLIRAIGISLYTE